MSPSGYFYNDAGAWSIVDTGYFKSYIVNSKHSLRPVLNLDVNVQATGSGTNSDPFVIE